MNKFKEIRPIALGLIEDEGKILVFEGYDSRKNETFYRMLGGGIEFGEYGKDALVREFQEEINETIRVNDHVLTVENIFTYEGKTAHEIVMVYKAEILSSTVKNEYTVKEGTRSYVAKWIDKKDFIDGTKILYPLELIEYLK